MTSPLFRSSMKVTPGVSGYGGRGMNEVLAKPLRRQTLLAVVARYLEQAGHGPADPPIDLERAIDEFGGRETVERVLRQFLTQADEQMAGLRAALAGGQREALRRLAHALKGGAATLEAAPLAAAAARLEQASAAGALPELEHLVNKITAELGRVNAYVGTASEMHRT